LPAEETFLSLRAVTREFEASPPVVAVRDVSLVARRGEIAGVVGRSGCGKTTLLRLMSGVDLPTSGDVQVGDVQVSALASTQRARWRLRTVSFIFQEFNLLPDLTAGENLRLALEAKGRSAPDAKSESVSALAEVGIDRLAERLPRQLSGGEQQRVAIARALALEAPLVLADEPTGSLDVENARIVGALLREVANRGSCVVVATHDPELTPFLDATWRLGEGALETENNEC
jgi:putative ABC transport system ATP-binding protein